MKTRELIIDYIDKKGITDKEELIAIITEQAETPEAEELRQRYLASIVNRVVATVRDDKGERIILAKRGIEGTKYVNLNKCKDLLILKDIQRRLQKEISGRGRSLKKVDLTITAVQLDLFKLLDGGKNAQ